ncbi:hypothetical protein THAOC_01692, partial [Thalassiosira oceanica]
RAAAYRVLHRVHLVPVLERHRVKAPRQQDLHYVQPRRPPLPRHIVLEQLAARVAHEVEGRPSVLVLEGARAGEGAHEELDDPGTRIRTRRDVQRRPAEAVLASKSERVELYHALDQVDGRVITGHGVQECHSVELGAPVYPFADEFVGLRAGEGDLGELEPVPAFD